ncbi:putative D,D-dipeptide transport system permease protein DdpC [Usitatibacter rugosus]|uniref:Putative D,D-dipeptide transport system permease protein DdpC n=1 Tax=Usitatibacter rugosus TaxID=2732067 RepID=A0A6M4GVM6_9PROT|nr:nickel transporter permease [Usitatibacter rugosus]QJR11236.1 putative D,D-dipeptide transport system permease protein DdpC [Usitatibacter rugosus]
MIAWLTAEVPESTAQATAQSVWLGARRLLRNPLAVGGFAVIVALVLVAIFAPWIAPYDPFDQSLTRRLLPPSAQHWFGTDQVGRDLFSRVVYGSRITLYIVVLVAVIVAPIGLLIGTIAGYAGGKVDAVLMRLTDIFLAFPGLVLALAFAAALGPGLFNAVIAISLTHWPGFARLARAETLIVRSSDYIAASRLQGASATRIVLRHVIPMCIPSVIVRTTLSMAGVILTAAGLGFLGLGAQPPSPEWGAMLAAGRRFLIDNWWMATFPGLAILLVSLAFNLLGDGLRDVLDPRNE